MRIYASRWSLIVRVVDLVGGVQHVFAIWWESVPLVGNNRWRKSDHGIALEIHPRIW